MKKVFFLFATFLLFVSTFHAVAQIPRTLSYQGVLTDVSSGKPHADGDYQFTFRLYEAATGGTAIWTEQKSLPVKTGLFATALGDGTPFGANVKFDRQYWLGIQVGNEPELSPRMALTSVGYSMNSLRADTAKVSMGGGAWINADSNSYLLGNVGIGSRPDSRYKLFVAGRSPQLTLRDTDAGVNQGICVDERGLGLRFDGGGALWVDRVTGNVSIGANPWDTKLFVSGTFPQISIQDVGANVRQGIGVNEYGLHLLYDQGRGLTVDRVTGNVGIGKTNPTSKLEIAGRTKTEVLEITGGSDVAEPFEMSHAEALPAGALVVIDKDNPGKLKLATEPYDKRVAGVISGAGGVNPGLTLSQEGVLQSGQNVALSGRVYALATAANGPIKPGDLLTTSALAGHAMKVTDAARSHGTVIGKAMSSLEKGKGLVLVLVNLQ